jgi:hypothetical protein
VIFPRVRPLRQIRDIIKPYNRLKIPTLDRGYADPRERLLHASFTILKEFVEDEMFEHTDWAAMIDVDNKLGQDEKYRMEDSYYREYRLAYTEILTLYYWWVYKRPHREDTIEHVVTMLAFDTLESPWEERKDGTYFSPSKPGTQFTSPLIDPFREPETGWNAIMKGDVGDKEMLKRLAEVQPYLWS